MSKSQTQQAVEAIISVTNHSGGKLRLNTEQRSKVMDELYSNYERGEYVIKSDKVGTDKPSVTKYMSKQISSVLQKTAVFNDGEKYTPKNVGKNNKEVKAIELLIEQLQADGNTAGVEQATAIRDEKLNELKAKKTTKTLNVDDLPESLRNLA
ncbi:MAG: hypothetical protein DRQ47_08110 [Gammaproteobacteria bacterium]|nr:MAG: hypothetical protein DRQ47_08110 [Gammaproteobacteria bacterium]